MSQKEQFFFAGTSTDELFHILKQTQNHLFHYKRLEAFSLPKPVCLQNEYMLNKFELNNRWLGDILPSLETIENFIKHEKKLFYVPEESSYYYLYYHLLLAYKNFLQSDKKIYDDERPLDYDYISSYLINKNLNATKFFELYLEKGIFLEDNSLKSAAFATATVLAAPAADVENVSREMSSEPLFSSEMTSSLAKSLTPPLFSEPENEVAKIVSPEPLFELEIDYPEEKKEEEE